MGNFLIPDNTITAKIGGETITIKQKIIPDTAKATKNICSYIKTGQPVKPCAKLGGDGKPRGICVHNTDNISVANGTNPAEQYSRATHPNGNMGGVVVHFYVDDTCAWRNLGDDYTSWHTATGGQGQGNCNTISIECIMENQTNSRSIASMENAAKLIAHIFKQYNWTVEKNLYTHNYWTNYLMNGKMSADISAQSLTKVPINAVGTNGKKANPNGKFCPVYILPQWEKFKSMIKKYLENSTEIPKISTVPSIPSTPKITENPNKIKAGDVVKLAENATYYGGQSIPGWVKNQNWIVKEIKSDRAVIDKNQSGTNNICSPVNVKFLTVITTSSPTPNYEIYTVVKGDSLWKIATQKLGNGKRYTEIKALNGLSNDTIIAGQKLKIPKK